MAQVIEFDTLARSTPTVKWPPDEQWGKVIPFMSPRREVSDELKRSSVSSTLVLFSYGSTIGS
jgi:hypothetical protein